MQNINHRDAFCSKKQHGLGLIFSSLRYLLEKKCHTPGTLGEGLRYQKIQYNRKLSDCLFSELRKTFSKFVNSFTLKALWIKLSYS